MPDDLSPLIQDWPNPTLASLAVTNSTTLLGSAGNTSLVSRIASISKLFAGMAALVAIEEGSVSLDEPAGPDGATVRHLLAHASGLAFDEHKTLAGVGKRRIYSNTGIEQFATHLEHRTEMAYGDYLTEAVITPLGLSDTELRGSPAHGVYSTVADLFVFARELLQPTLIHPSTLANAITAQFNDLAGVVPGFGRFGHNPWGLTFEIKGTKHPHWTAPSSSLETFGHFGGSGTYLWVDPVSGLAAAAISGSEFGEWAIEAWPTTNTKIVERYN